MKAKEAIEHIRQFHKDDEEVCMILWTREDIEYVLDKLNITLTQEEIDAILNHLEEKQDFNFGITWSIVENVVEYRHTIGRRR